MGASSTGGEMTRGRGGSEVEPWLGVALGILRRVDRDEDLDPRVLAMVVWRRWSEVRAVCSGGEGRREVALAWLLLVPF